MNQERRLLKERLQDLSKTLNESIIIAYEHEDIMYSDALTQYEILINNYWLSTVRKVIFYDQRKPETLSNDNARTYIQAVSDYNKQLSK